MLSGAHFSGDAASADNGLHVGQERQLGAADTDNRAAILAPMCPGQRDRSFSIDDPRHIGCIDF